MFVDLGVIILSHSPDFERHLDPKVVPTGNIWSPLEGIAGNVKTIASRIRNHHFEGCRGSRETSCAAVCAQCFSRCFPEQVFLDFLSFWCPDWNHWGTLGFIFFGIFVILFQRLMFERFGGDCLGVPAAGEKPVKSAQDSELTPVTPGYPCGVRRILWGFAPAASPSVNRQAFNGRP